MKTKNYQRFGAKIRERSVSYLSSSDTRKITELLYITANGKSLSLFSLFPVGWELVRFERDSFGCDHNEKLVFFGTSRKIKTRIGSKAFAERIVRPMLERGFFLHLFHEIGHAHLYARASKDDQRKNDEVATDPKFTFKRKDHFTPEERDLYQRYVIQEEREAWAWALRTFRWLKRCGIDLEPAIRRNSKILVAVSAALATYLYDLDPEELEKAQGIVLFQS